MAIPGAEDLGFELIPPDRPVSPEDDLAASEASLNDLPASVEDPPVVLGRTWAFDFVNQRFVRSGFTPAGVSGRDALAEWCMTMLGCAKGRVDSVLPPWMGTEALDEEIGELATPEVLGSIKRRIYDNLTVHDRITDVTMTVSADPLSGVVFLTNLVVTTDEPSTIKLPDTKLAA